METLTTQYLQSVSRDGGWSYLPGQTKPSIEATVWCAIACRTETSSKRCIDFLLSAQNQDGGWSDQPGLNSDWATAPALLALGILQKQHHLDDKSKEAIRQAADKGFQCLLSLRTDLITDFTRVWMMVVEGPDFDYPRGWPWQPDTYNWVEPTAYAIAAIKFAGLAENKRYKSAVMQAQTYMLSKTCKPAGWNFGAPRTLGNDAPPMPLPTALAIISMQDAKDAQIDAALDYLAHLDGPVVDTTIADAYRLLARDVRGEDVSSEVAAFVKRYHARDHAGENLLSVAAATIVCTLPEHGNPFKLVEARS